MRQIIHKASNDYQPVMLPQNRKDVFLDVMQIHWRSVLGLGFVAMFFLLPLFLLLWIRDEQLLNIQELASALAPQQFQEAWYNYANADNIRSGVSVVCWVWFGIGLAGILRIMRQYAWEESVHFFSDFLKGVRDNAKNTVVLCFLMGVICGICTGTYNMLPYGPSYLSWVSLIQIGLFAVLLLPVFALWLSMIPVYRNSVLKYILFSFAVYLKSFFKTLIVSLACMILALPVLLPIPALHIIGLFIISFLLPVVLLMWTLYSYALFDLYINPKFYPELINKGVLGKQLVHEKEAD